MKNITAKSIVIKSMVATALLAAAGVTLAQSGPANAFGVVISATPVVQQVTVPQQVCTTTIVQSYQPAGGGALIGALVGGALGNQIGRGHGQDSRAIATVVGALGGGFVGNQIEAQNYAGQYPNQTCHTQNTVENRTVSHHVLYEYAGQRYTVQMPATGDFRPGARIALYMEAPLQNYAPVQTVTYMNPVAPVVYYYDSFAPTAPRYFYNSNYYAPRAVQRPVHTVRHPVQPVRYDRGHDDYRNWR
jgi:uncharacterized protein YcfJ